MKQIERSSEESDSLRPHYDLNDLEVVAYGPGWAEARRRKKQTLVGAPKATVNLSLSKELSQRAKTIPKAERKKFIESLRETDLHVYLKELFQVMQPDYIVEITHGTEERGKDLVIVKRDMITIDVIGVVVKRGSIMSKTLGEVDEVVESVNSFLKTKPDRKLREIQSQIRQSFDNRAELKTVFKLLSVNKVFVVLAGEISNRGRTRLTNEVKGPVEVLDMDWLIQKFTEFYPQVFFEGRVTDFVHLKIQELETKSWHLRENQNLSDCYVEPIVRSVDVPLLIDDAKIATAIATKRLPFSKLRSAISPSQRVILVGDPGTGKSAAMAKLSIEMLRETYSTITRHRRGPEKPEVPLLVEAKQILDKDNVEELLLSYFGDPHVASRVHVKVLMVDALDEVPSSRRDEVIVKLKNFADTLECGLVLTSRKIDLLSFTPAGFRKYELLPFEAGQALKLFEKIHGKDQLLDSLKIELNKIKYQIPMVPLSLILLMELVEENKEVPASITELYERYTDIVLGRYDKKKRIEVLFDYTIKKRFLSALAYNEFLNKSRLEIPHLDYRAFLERYAGQYGIEQEFINGFVKEIERAGVLRINEDDVSFGHRSFLDYFTAFYIYDKRDEFENVDDFIIERYFDDTWGDTAFFYIGHKKEISEKLLSRLMDYSSGGDKLKEDTSKFLSGQLLQAAWHSTKAAKQYGIERAFDLIPQLRTGVITFTEEKKLRLPKIFADFAVLIWTDHSFRSSFLEKEVGVVFRQLLQDKRNLLGLPFLLWALKPFLTGNQLQESTEEVLDAIVDTNNLAAEEKAKALLILRVVEQENKQVKKAIQRKLEFIRDKNPGLFTKLLPKPTRGARPISHKRNVRDRR